MEDTEDGIKSEMEYKRLSLPVFIKFQDPTFVKLEELRMSDEEALTSEGTSQDTQHSEDVFKDDVPLTSASF